MTNATKQLYRKLEQAHLALKSATEKEDKIALANYLGNLYAALICIGEHVEFDIKTSFGSEENYKKFDKALNRYWDRLINNYVKNQEFHRSFFGEILPPLEEELCEIFQLPYSLEESEIPEKDFYEIMFEFMKSIHQEELFQRFYNNKKVYSCVIGETENNIGFALFNPIEIDSDIFIKDFKYNMNTMKTLMHEFGHAIDFSNFKGTLKDYNEYFYLSFYGEVMSRLNERLFLRYLIKNNIYKREAKEKYIEFHDLNHDYLLQAYILSLLDKKTILNNKFLDYSQEEMMSQIRPFFLAGTDLSDVLDRMDEESLWDIYNYAYGDIISLFLCDTVEKEGFSNELLEYFLAHRTEPFHEKFLRDCGFGPADYVKKYKKESNILKK